MKGRRFTEEQIIRALKEAEAGLKVNRVNLLLASQNEGK